MIIRLWVTSSSGRTKRGERRNDASGANAYYYDDGRAEMKHD